MWFTHSIHCLIDSIRLVECIVYTACCHCLIKYKMICASNVNIEPIHNIRNTFHVGHIVTKPHTYTHIHKMLNKSFCQRYKLLMCRNGPNRRNECSYMLMNMYHHNAYIIVMLVLIMLGYTNITHHAHKHIQILI